MDLCELVNTDLTNPVEALLILFLLYTSCTLFHQEGSKADIFDWLKDVVVPNLYNTHSYNDAPVNDYARKFISDYYAIRLGPPRLRMLRVKPSNPPFLRFVVRFIHVLTIFVDK